MYVITSKTSNDIAFDVITNEKVSTVHLTEAYLTATSDELTRSIEDLNAIGVLSYAKVEDNPVQNSTSESNTNRGRGRKNSNQSTESTVDENKVEDEKSDEDKKDEGGK